MPAKRITLDAMVGNEDALTVLRQVNCGFILISGPSGCGKTTAALAKAKAITRQWLRDDGENSIQYMTEDGERHAAYYSLGRNLSKKDVEGLDGRYHTPPLWPVYVRIIDEAHNIPDNIVDPLKVLNPRHNGRLFIFCTTEPRDLNPALVQRCAKVFLSPLGLTDTTALIARDGYGPDVAKAINDGHITAPREIIEVCDQMRDGLSVIAAINNVKSMRT